MEFVNCGDSVFFFALKQTQNHEENVYRCTLENDMI